MKGFKQWVEELWQTSGPPGLGPKIVNTRDMYNSQYGVSGQAGAAPPPPPQTKKMKKK